MLLAGQLEEQGSNGYRPKDSSGCFWFSFSREEAGIYSHKEKNIQLDLCYSVLVPGRPLDFIGGTLRTLGFSYLPASHNIYI